MPGSSPRDSGPEQHPESPPAGLLAGPPADKMDSQRRLSTSSDASSSGHNESANKVGVSYTAKSCQNNDTEKMKSFQNVNLKNQRSLLWRRNKPIGLYELTLKKGRKIKYIKMI